MSFVCQCHALPTLPLLPKSKAATTHFTNKNQTLARAKNVHAGRLLQVFTALPGFVIDVTTFHKVLLTSEYIAGFFILYSTLLMPCRIFIYWSETWYIGSFFFTHPVEWEKERERERKKERKKEETKTTDRAFPYLCLAIGQPSNR